MYTNAWRTGHNLAGDVLRACHSYLVQTVLAPHVSSLRASLLHREVGFFHGLLASPSREVTVAALISARDLRSTAGANLALVREVSGLHPWTGEKGAPGRTGGGGPIAGPPTGQPENSCAAQAFKCEADGPLPC